MFSLLKPVRLKRYLLLPLLAALLLAGCSQAQPDSAGGGPVLPAGSQAAQTLRPEGTAIPSAPADGMAASTSGAAPAGAEAGAADASPPAAPGGAGTGSAPSSAAGVTDTPAPVPAATAGKPAPTLAGTNQPAAAAASAAAPRPSATTAAAASAAAPRPSATTAAASSAAASQPPAATATPVNAVTLSITGDKEHGIILAPSAYEIEKNETALELLKRITRKHKIQMEYQGSKTFAYVEGIDNLYEYDHGAESGWMYKVNGEFPSAASGSWIVKPGDTVEWLYTLDLGKDLGAAKP